MCNTRKPETQEYFQFNREATRVVHSTCKACRARGTATQRRAGLVPETDHWCNIYAKTRLGKRSDYGDILTTMSIHDMLRTMQAQDHRCPVTMQRFVLPGRGVKAWSQWLQTLPRDEQCRTPDLVKISTLVQWQYGNAIFVCRPMYHMCDYIGGLDSVIDLIEDFGRRQEDQ